MKLTLRADIALIFSLWALPVSCSSAAKMQGSHASKDKRKSMDSYPEKIPSISAPEYETDIEETSSAAEKVELPAAKVKASLVKGRIRDAQNAEGIAGAAVSIFNSKGELVVNPFSSSPNGTFPIPELSPGDYKMKITANGYIDADQDFSIAANEVKTVEVLLSTVLNGSTFRAVLSWGTAPLDLDAHLKIIDVATGQVVSDIYYDNYTFEDLNVKAFLDIDNYEGFGPETITFDVLTPGKYKLQFFVNNYNGVPGAKGDINVKLFQGRSILGSYSLQPGSPGLTGPWNWIAFELDTAVNVIPVKAFGAPFAYDFDPLVGTRRPR